MQRTRRRLHGTVDEDRTARNNACGDGVQRCIAGQFTACEAQRLARNHDSIDQDQMGKSMKTRARLSDRVGPVLNGVGWRLCAL